MSGRRPRSRQTQSSRSVTDDQINDLVHKLQQLLPDFQHGSSDKIPAAVVLQNTCNYIKSLHREVDDLSERISELFAANEFTSGQVALIRDLLGQ